MNNTGSHNKFIIYIAGPMRGIKLYNFPAFDRAKKLLESLGHQVVSPADIDRENGFDPGKMTKDFDWSTVAPELDAKELIRRDMSAIIEKCNGMFMLYGWENSKGARLEHSLAEFLGLHIEYQQKPDDLDGCIEVSELVEDVIKTGNQGPRDPDHIPQHTPGAKLDNGKNRLDLVFGGFAKALWAVGEVATFGAGKYTDDGWKYVKNGCSRYEAAKNRHYLQERCEGMYDNDSRLLHAAHEAWNSLARLELILDSGVKAHAEW